MLHDKRKSGFPPTVTESNTQEKRSSRDLKGLTFQEGEERTKPQEGSVDKPKVDKELLKKKTKEDEGSEQENQEQLAPQKEGSKDDKREGVEKQVEKPDENVGKVVSKAESLEGSLKHRQNAGGAAEALKEDSQGEPTMNCWDAVLYIAAQAGALKSDVIQETAKRSQEGYEKFTKNELPGIREKEQVLNTDFAKINKEIDEARQQIAVLQKDVKSLQTTFSKYLLWTKGAREKKLGVVQKQIDSLGDKIKDLQSKAQENMKARKVQSDLRMKGELEARNRPYKDLLKVDQAEVILTTTRAGKNGKPETTLVEGKWPPPAGYTILLTHENSMCPDFDHVMLSLGGGKVAHLQSVTPTELGLKGFDAGKLKSVDLLEYMKVAAGTSESWSVKAAPPCWG